MKLNELKERFGFKDKKYLIYEKKEIKKEIRNEKKKLKD